MTRRPRRMQARRGLRRHSAEAARPTRLRHPDAHPRPRPGRHVRCATPRRDRRAGQRVHRRVAREDGVRRRAGDHGERRARVEGGAGTMLLFGGCSEPERPSVLAGPLLPAGTRPGVPGRSEPGERPPDPIVGQLHRRNGMLLDSQRVPSVGAGLRGQRCRTLPGETATVTATLNRC